MPGLSPEVFQSLVSLGPLILMVLVFYFLMYLPQQKAQKSRDEMLNNLKKGDRIITSGGVYGTIVALDAKKVTLKVSDKVEMDFLRTAVQSYQVAKTKS